MGRCILLVCVTDWGVSVLIILMSHRESYSSVSVSRVNWYIRCGYSGCVSLYESGMVGYICIIRVCSRWGYLIMIFYSMYLKISLNQVFFKKLCFLNGFG